MSQVNSERSVLDIAALQAVPAFFAMATLLMGVHLLGLMIWLAPQFHGLQAFAPLMGVVLNTALAAAGWKIKALHTRRFLAGFWLFLGLNAFVSILQNHVGVDSMLCASLVICTAMAAQLLNPSAAKVCWTVLAFALLGLYGTEQAGWMGGQNRDPFQGVVMGLALLVLGMLQARFFNQAGEATRRMLLEREQQARAAAEEASRAKSDFLSVMSHEIRTPLNGIVGLVTLAQDERVDARSRQHYLQMLSQSSQALSNLVSGVLDFSKIEAGRIDLVSEPFSLVEWTQDLEHNFIASAAIKGLYLQVERDASAGDGALGDAVRLRQIAANYISNAIKFTKAGTIRVRISRPRGDALLRLEVRDSGIGLTDAAQAQLFKPFVQGHAQVQREFGGTGLGLSICERLAQSMNGTVGVSSRPGVGSTFWAELQVPMDARGDAKSGDAQSGDVQSADAVTSSRQHAADRPHTNRDAKVERGQAFIDLDAARVLVVDDNAVNRTITSQMLRRMNAIVSTASDGQEGLEAMRVAQREGWPYDMVLMDVQMPVMDGLTAVGLIRQDISLGDTPVVALTAGVLKDDVTRAIEAGMDGFLAKPVTAEQMGRNVAHFVEMGRQRRLAALRSTLRF